MNLKLKHLVLPLVLSLGLVHSSYAASSAADPKVLHLINRLSFGPRPGDVERVETMGVERYIQEQLSPESIPEPQSLTQEINSLQTLHMTPGELYREYTPQRVAGQKPSREAVQAARQRSGVVVQQAIQGRLLRATASPRQLEEVMTDFWFNHFNVYADKGLDRLWVGAYEEEAIRPYALGHFRQLLEATAKHPAMLFYLDNWQNTAPNSPGAKGRFHGLNENYARELMELHTLGVEGGYTQQDVTTLARILTGWGFTRPLPQDTSDGYWSSFDAKRHDFSDKVFLGQTIKGSGLKEGEQALDILARSPATAHHISYQLAQYFVADQPPPALVDRLAQRFQQTDGDIREVLNTLFHSPEFWDAKNYNAKFKTPYQYVVSAVRATGVEVHNFRPIYGMLQQLGMPLYGCLTPDGYKNTQDAWLNPDAITRRLSFATALASGRMPLSQYPPNLGMANPPFNSTTPSVNGQMPGQDQTSMTMPNPPIVSLSKSQPVDATQLTNTLGNHFSAQTQSAIASSPPQLSASLILGSPEFMHH